MSSKGRTSKGSKASARVRGLDGVAVGRSAWGLYRETRRPGAPGLAARLWALPRLLRDALTGRYPGVGPGKLLLLAFAVAVYFVSPIDAVPDFIPVLGWGDDTAVVLWFLMGLTRESGRYVEWAAGRSSEAAEAAELQ
ncbi:YkvA family protein [Kitasatospora sp. NPDC088134]|uniref:YkvA family protein n=1 Tax=Kitasatospora sp. NPDC088134 TaxID=3364071 RepID=UPI0038145F4C